MNTKFIYIKSIIIALTVFTYSCSSGDDSPNNNSNNTTAEIQQITDNAASGTWRITSYVDSGQDETNHFNGYNFTFASNGTLSATDGNNTVNGTWSVSDSSNSNDDSNDDIDFNISFASPADFLDLSDDWDIVSHTNTRIELIDISGGNGGTDTLIFQKN